MKKVLAVAMVLAMLACVFAVNVAAVDNYEPKTINLIANADGTVSLPEGYVVYIGDTLVFPRGEVVFIGDYEIRDSGGQIKEMAVGQLNDIMIEINGVRVGQSWSDYLPLKNSTVSNTNDYWFEDGTNLEVAGKFEFFAFSAHDAAWTEQYFIKPEVKILSIEVVDPKTASEIVLPPSADTPVVDTPATDVPADEPATDVPTTDVPTDEPTTDVPTTDVPTTDVPTDEPTTSTPADPNNDSSQEEQQSNGAPAEDNTVIYVVIAIAAAAVVAVVIVLVSKKKK